MSAFTLAEARANLTATCATITAVLANQEYTIAGRTYRRADLRALQEERKYWTIMVENLENNGAMKVTRVIPVGL